MVSRYILKEASTIFFPLFFTLLFVASVVLFVKISSLTSIISVSFFELFFLFFYSIPLVLFFVIPLSLFVSYVITLARLSNDFELPVLFSLGVSPRKLVRIFFPVSLMAFIILCLISLVLVPLSKSVYEDFLERKQDSNALNIKASEVGQKLGEWLVHIEKQDGDILQNVALFSNTAFDEESFLHAKEARVSSNAKEVVLNLKDGGVVMLQEDYVDAVNFKEMQLINSINAGREPFAGVLEHWLQGFWGDEKRAKEFSQAILISAFPLLSLFFVLAFGLVNPRSRNVFTYLYIGIYIGLYYGGVYFVSFNYPLLGTLIFLLIVPLIGKLTYRCSKASVF